MPSPLRWICPSEGATQQVGERLAALLRPGSVVLLNGDLGVGKTVFARGVIQGLGVLDPYITSPTFTLMNSYPEGRIPVYHFDFYRVASSEELALAGVEAFLEGEGVALVEWAERGGSDIPADHLSVVLSYSQTHEESRTVEISAQGSLSIEIWNALRLQNRA